MLNDNQQRIDAYLRGKMSESERIQFEKELKDNDRLRQNFEIFKQLQSALAEREAMKEKMRKWDLEKKVQKRLRVRRWCMAGVSVAACLALGLFALKPLLPHDSSPNESVPIRNTAAAFPGANSKINTVDSLIGIGKYAKALSLCDSLTEQYCASLYNYKRVDAYPEKTKYRERLDDAFLYELEWRRIKILMSFGREEEAHKLLNHFAVKNGKYRSEAEQLLKK